MKKKREITPNTYSVQKIAGKKGTVKKEAKKINEVKMRNVMQTTFCALNVQNHILIVNQTEVGGVHNLQRLGTM